MFVSTPDQTGCVITDMGMSATKYYNVLYVRNYTHQMLSKMQNEHGWMQVCVRSIYV
jgi:hypothetical protein